MNGYERMLRTTQQKTLYEYLRDRAAANPDGIMFYGKESLSFGQVLRLVCHRVACLTKADIRGRDVLALRADRNADVSVMILAPIKSVLRNC